MRLKWKPVALVVDTRLKRALLVLLAVVLVAGVAVVAHEPVVRVLSRTGNVFLDERKATWAWDAAVIDPAPKGTTGQGPQAFLDSLRQLNINRVFLNAGWEKTVKGTHLQSHADQYTTFVKQASARGIAVDALFGEPTWARAASLPTLEQHVQLVLDFNAKSKTRFNALHLDIEPYGCPGYGGQRALILQEYLANLTRVRTMVDAHNKTTKDDLLLVLDLPAWWTDSEPVVDGKALVPQLIALADEVVVMNYVTDPAEFSAQAKSWLTLGQTAGKKIMIGVDFQGSTRQDGLCTKSRADLQTFFQAPLAEFRANKAFNGIAVHHYAAYKDFSATLR